MTGQRFRVWILTVLWAGAIAAVPACRNPFRTYEDEYGRLADPQSLRSAEVLPLAEKAVDESEGASELPSMGPPANQELEISIEQCRAWTLENNLDLQVSLMDPQIAATSITEAEARFEALFVASGSLSDADPGQAEVFRDQFVRPFDIAPGIQIPMRTGGTASVAVPLSRRETFPGFPDDDRYATDLDFSISQPLLRHAGRRANTHRIRIAALDSQIVQAGTKLEVIRQIAAVDRAYWLMDATKEIRAVRRRQYRRAQEQLQQATARFEGGVGPKIEVIRARAGLARRNESIIIAELDVKDSQRSLKRIVNLPDADVDSKVTLVLTSQPDRVSYELDEDELIEAALRERVELLELELKVAQDYSTIDFEENRKLPLFTLDYIYRIHGTGSSARRSAESATEGRAWGWQLGLNLEVPIGNEAAEARVHRAILTRLQRLATRTSREQSVKQEVLDALDNLHATWRRILASDVTVGLEAQNYQAEQGQYQLGLRNSTEVLFAEERLADANVASINAVLDYQIARIDLAFATGMLLGASRITW